MPGQVPPVSDEREGLLAYLAQQRDAIRIAAYGLTEEQLRAAPSASSLSVGGLLKHVTSMERGWIDTMLQRSKSEKDWEEAAEEYGSGFLLTPEDTLTSLLDEYAKAAAETEEAVAGIPDLGQAVPVPQGVPWLPDDVKEWSVRWVLLHLIEETARHAGHADTVRESVDGATAYELMAAAEQWPATDWLKPWTPQQDT
jgi:uncharacterized damage-inducible protein DinB